jgi:anaerobic C4-dicarboxylate transporter
MPVVIEIVMLSVAAIMLLVTKVAVDEVPRTATLRAGVVAVIGIFGLAWLGDSFIAANKDVIVPAIGAGRGAHRGRSRSGCSSRRCCSTARRRRRAR